MDDAMSAWVTEAFARHHAPLCEQLARIENQLERLIEMSGTNTNSLANLQAAVAAQTTVGQSVITLLTTLSAQLSAASPTGDNPAVDAVVATMTANSAALSAAVLANTPPVVAPPVVAPPVAPTP
jgi:hypothetical protein